MLPAVPEKEDVGLDELPKDPPVPLTTLQAPVLPVPGGFPARVTVVRPQVADPFWAAPALAVVTCGVTVMVTLEEELQPAAVAMVHVRT